ncbi:hypothetical protein [Nostoc sp. FACHB-110]|uniref:hypothetical protein n=1 Tax=Nostoc sp. FACHB-110 TaxID=2692834 RepID=UPI001685796E|nr:hypothetical protein [Nostoc sp. FACHB-110]MBD2440990.1 hypothetical protein [Nostoc sp. FACHB-110]
MAIITELKLNFALTSVFVFFEKDSMGGDHSHHAITITKLFSLELSVDISRYEHIAC